MSEYAYAEEPQEKTHPPVWIRHAAGWGEAQAALRDARANLGPQAIILIGDIAPVDFEDVRPGAEQLLGDMKERLVNIAGIGSDLLLDQLDRTQLNKIDSALSNALETVFHELNIPTDFGAFRVRTIRKVLPGQGNI